MIKIKITTNEKKRDKLIEGGWLLLKEIRIDTDRDDGEYGFTLCDRRYILGKSSKKSGTDWLSRVRIG